MKKVYEAPCVEKVEFQYRDQVVVASGGNYGQTVCTTSTKHYYENDSDYGVASACHVPSKCETITVVADTHD